MSIVEFLSRLRRLDVRIWVDGDRLRYNAPEGVMTSELRGEIGAQRAQLMEFLRESQGMIGTVRHGAGTELPLSYAQQRLWFLDQLMPGSSVYNIPSVFRITGVLDSGVLQSSLNEVVQRHESLRTVFGTSEGRAVQRFGAFGHVPLRVVDLKDLEPAKREAEARRVAIEDVGRPFDLGLGPLLRAGLVRLGEGEHVGFFCMHHIISDGWSMGVLVRDLVTLYQAFLAGRPSPLPELPIQYADYAVWQREQLRGQVLEEQLSYWRGRLAGAPELLVLPTDRPRPAVQTYAGSHQSLALSREVLVSLKEVGRRENSTLFMVLLAAFQVLLYRYTGQEDVVVGSPIAGRNRVELEGLIGFFANTLVLRGDVSGNPTFRELLGRVREVTLGAYEHQDLPFEQLVEELEPRRDLSHAPLFQVMLVLQNAPRQVVELPGVRLRALAGEGKTAKFDLTLSLWESGTGLEGYLEYNTDLFDGRTIVRMVEHFRVLVEGIVTDPDQRVSYLPLLTKAEKQRLLVEWNDTRRDYPQERSIQELFEEQVGRTPEAVAVVFPSTGSGQAPSTGSGQGQVTYGELNRRANQLAHYLWALGVGAEVRVGICLERSVEMVVAILGVLKAGGAYVPLDPSYPRERLEFMMEDSGITVLLTQESLSNQHLAFSIQPEESIQHSAVSIQPEELRTPVDARRMTHDASHPSPLTSQRSPLSSHRPKTVCLDREWPAIARESVDNPEAVVSGRNLAYVIYTSGSTGRPKGAMNTQRGIRNRLVWMQEEYGLTAADRVLQKTPFSFDVSVWEFFWPLLNGACLVMTPAELHRDSAYLAELISSEEVTTLHFVPSMLRMFIQERDIDKCGSLKRVICSGEALPFDLQERFFECCAAELHNLYGPTEAAVDVTFWACERVADRCVVPIGTPIANIRIYLLDLHGENVPVHVQGELCIGGEGVARGYLSRPDLTAEKFVPNPFGNAAGEQLYRTGDLARYLPGGHLEFLGRVDYQVKLRGFRIELGEVEAVLRQHSAVREAVVVARGRETGDRGPGAGVSQHPTPDTQYLAAYVVWRGEGRPDVSELRGFLRAKLPEYMVPSSYVMVEELPLTPSGKVDRRALPEPDRGRPDMARQYVAPRTRVEERLAGIWADVLGVERVGIHDNFFELGGHSLLATQLVSRVRVVFGMELPLRELFESPTVVRLAECIEAAGGRESQRRVGLVRRGDKREEPLSYGQQRLWFLDQLMPGSSVYNIPSVFWITGLLDIGVLQLSVNEVVRRHESLRAVFGTSEGRGVQRIRVHGEVVVGVVDLGGLGEVEREGEARRVALGEVGRPFDLEEGPLLRAGLVRLGKEEYVGFFCMHHIISDGWSMGVLIRELAVLYRAFSVGEPSPLPELPIQYGDYAVWQREALQGRVLEEQLSYWRRQLAGAPELLELPADRPRPAVQTHRGSRQSVSVSREVLEGLRELGREEGSTLFMVLLAAFQTLLYRYSGEEDIVVGSPIAGRNRVELEGLIGFFVNTLVLRGDVSGNPTFRELLGRVREVTLGAYEHQELPFEQLVEELEPRRDLSHAPLFQVMLVLQNAPREVVELRGVRLRELEGEKETAKFDLTLALSESETGLEGSLEYNTDLYDRGTIVRMVEHFRVLVEGIVAGPDQRVSYLPLLTEAEERRLLAEWNDTRRAYPQGQGIQELFEAQVGRTPEAVAVVFPSTGSGQAPSTGHGEEGQVTYGELNRRANHLAHYLRALGVGAEVRVGICLERSVEMVVAILGVLKAGGAYVPLDPSYPRERLEFMIEDARIAVLLTQESLSDQQEESGQRSAFSIQQEELWTPDARRTTHDASQRSPLSSQRPTVVCLDREWPAIARERSDNPQTVASGQNLAYVIYTSGSTGRPKGVSMCHGALHNLIAWQAARLPDPSRTLQFASLGFDVSFQEMFSTWSTGGCLVLIQEQEQVDAGALLSLVDQQQIERLFLPFVALQYVVRVAAEKAERQPTLQHVITAGEQLQITQPLIQWFADPSPCILHNHYGPSETHVATAFELAPPARDWPTLPPIGRPIGNLRMFLVDRFLQLAAIGVAGELLIGGAGVARGYFDHPELTAANFIPDPFSGVIGERVYRTGDSGRYRDCGDLEFRGRVDHQVKVRGFRIELGEVESVLRQHPAVREAVVVARGGGAGGRRPGTGDGGPETDLTPDTQRLAAYVVSDGEARCDVSELRGFLRAKLPGYMMPSSYVMLEELPLTPSGKVDRRALPEPDRARPEMARQYVAPRTALEERLAGIWADVLGVERVGIHDNFFELGGHSLLATQLISRIRVVFEVQLQLRELFESPTVARLAACIEAAGGRELQARVGPVQRSMEQEQPLSYAQQRMPAVTVPRSEKLSSQLDESPEQSSSFVEVERRPLLSLITSGEVAPVDSAALGYIPSAWLEADLVRREQVERWRAYLPVVTRILDMPIGRIAVILLPSFDGELYSEPNRLLAAIDDGLELARLAGARAVSLTGLLPSATDYGRAVLAMRQSDRPTVSTGHATTTATVALAIERILREAGRQLEGERVGFLGLGSVGKATLDLMLRCLPHPHELLLCDVYDKFDWLERIGHELREKGFRGRVTLIQSRGEVPAAFYGATLIVGATNVPDILDVSLSQPGTLIVDDSAPHCFVVRDAVERFETRGDILFTEGGSLEAASPIRTLFYHPREVETLLNQRRQTQLFSQYNPLFVTGCVLSSLLSAKFQQLEPTIGLVRGSDSMRHFQALGRLGFAAPPLRCRDYRLDPGKVAAFRGRFGGTSVPP